MGKNLWLQIGNNANQGGHISPLLFILFINGIKNVFQYCCFLIFDDEMKLFLQIGSEADFHCLQNEINNLVKWLNAIGLSLNVDKCQSTSLNRRLITISFSYSICGTSLEFHL